MKHLIIALTLCLSGTGFAIVKPFQAKKMKRDLPQSCSDFSGSWKGTCDADSNPFEFTINISQEECHRITTDTGTYEIGVSETKTKNFPGFMSTVMLNLNWSLEGKILVYSQIFTDVNIETTNAHSTKLDGSFQLDSERLVLQMNSNTLCYLDRD